MTTAILGDSIAVGIRMHPGDYARLERLATQRRLAVASLARQLICQALDAIDGPPDPEAAGWEPQP